MTRSFSRMLTAEKSSKLSAQSPACSRKALPAATWPRRGLQRAGLAGEHQRGIGGDLLQRPIEVALIRPLGLLLGRKPLPRRRCPRLCHARNANCRAAISAVIRLRMQRRAIHWRANGASRAWPQSEAADGVRGDSQAARMRTASSRRPATARLTSRRAASAVTPRFSPTSRKLLRSPSSRPKRASIA